MCVFTCVYVSVQRAVVFAYVCTCGGLLCMCVCKCVCDWACACVIFCFVYSTSKRRIHFKFQFSLTYRGDLPQPSQPRSSLQNLFVREFVFMVCSVGLNLRQLCVAGAEVVAVNTDRLHDDCSKCLRLYWGPRHTVRTLRQTLVLHTSFYTFFFNPLLSQPKG